MEPWKDWDPVMQEDYLAEIDLTVGERLVMETRRKVLDATKADSDAGPGETVKG